MGNEAKKSSGTLLSRQENKVVCSAVEQVPEAAGDAPVTFNTFLLETGFYCNPPWKARVSVYQTPNSRQQDRKE